MKSDSCAVKKCLWAAFACLVILSPSVVSAQELILSEFMVSTPHGLVAIGDGAVGLVKTAEPSQAWSR